MHTLIRDREITTPDFVFYSDRLIRLVMALFLATSTSPFLDNFLQLSGKVELHGS